MLVSPTTLLQQESGKRPPPKSLYLKMDLKVLAGGGFQWFSLERKKDLSVLFSMTYRLQWMSVDHNLERETGLEFEPYSIELEVISQSTARAADTILDLFGQSSNPNLNFSSKEDIY